MKVTTEQQKRENHFAPFEDVTPAHLALEQDVHPGIDPEKAIEIGDKALLKLIFREKQKMALPTFSKKCVCSLNDEPVAKRGLLVECKAQKLVYLCWWGQGSGLGTIQVFECRPIPCIELEQNRLSLRDFAREELNIQRSVGIWDLRAAAVTRIMEARWFLGADKMGVPDVLLTVVNHKPCEPLGFFLLHNQKTIPQFQDDSCTFTRWITYAVSGLQFLQSTVQKIGLVNR